MEGHGDSNLRPDLGVLRELSAYGAATRPDDFAPIIAQMIDAEGNSRIRFNRLIDIDLGTAGRGVRGLSRDLATGVQEASQDTDIQAFVMPPVRGL
jgi:hypothetical protein